MNFKYSPSHLTISQYSFNFHIYQHLNFEPQIFPFLNNLSIFPQFPLNIIAQNSINSIIAKNLYTLILNILQTFFPLNNFSIFNFHPYYLSNTSNPHLKLQINDDSDPNRCRGTERLRYVKFEDRSRPILAFTPL